MKKNRWEIVKNSKYVAKIKYMLENLEGSSILDVGSNNCEIVNFGNFQRRVCVDKNRVPEIDGVETFLVDWMDYPIEEKFDVICGFQIIEHLKNDIIYDFINKMFENSRLFVFLSTSYMWAHNSPHHHQDPISLEKLKNLVSDRKFLQHEMIIEKHSKKTPRILAVYKGEG